LVLQGVHTELPVPDAKVLLEHNAQEPAVAGEM